MPKASACRARRPRRAVLPRAPALRGRRAGSSRPTGPAGDFAYSCHISLGTPPNVGQGLCPCLFSPTLPLPLLTLALPDGVYLLTGIGRGRTPALHGAPFRIYAASVRFCGGCLDKSSFFSYNVTHIKAMRKRIIRHAGLQRGSGGCKLPAGVGEGGFRALSLNGSRGRRDFPLQKAGGPLRANSGGTAEISSP